MKRIVTTLMTALPLVLSAIILFSSGQTIDAQQQPQIRRQPLMQRDATIPGYDLAMTIVEIPAGVSEIRHTHPGPLAVYVAEGELILEHEGRPSTTYKAGESVLVEAGKIHQGINRGAVTVKLITTLVAEKGKPANSPVP
jgi:quercetin dioxygenase-like cupin family protein